MSLKVQLVEVALHFRVVLLAGWLLINFMWSVISLFSEAVSMKLATSMYHVSGKKWKQVRGQRSRSLGLHSWELCECDISNLL